MIQKTEIVMIRLSKKEYDFLSCRADQDQETHYKNGTLIKLSSEILHPTEADGKRNLSGYIRKTVLERSGYRKSNRQELKNLNFQIRKIGVNINQATKKINSGYYDRKICEDLQNSLEELNRHFQELQERMEEQDGSNKAASY